jgi:uncharacterized protein
MNPEEQIKFQPTQKKARINSLDVIRGIAVLGILLMNINGMGLPFAYSDPSIAGGADGLNLQVWIMNEMFFEGTMRGLFTLLFGAGVVLLTSRLEKSGAGIATADIYYRRTLWLLVFGIFNVYILLWHGDILYPYAIFGLMLFPFRNADLKKLILGAFLLIVIGVLWDISDYRNDLKTKKEGIELQKIKDQGLALTDDQEASLEKWEKLSAKKTPEEVAKKIDLMHQGYWAVLMEKVKGNQFMQTWLPYRLWPWDILSFMLLGIAFFKLRIFHGERKNKFYLILMGIGYLVGLSINYYETQMQLDSNFDPVVIAKATQTYQIGRLFTTLGHVGLFMLFIKSGILGFLQRSFAAVGQLALTNYLMQSVITSIIFYGDGLALFGTLQRYQLYYIVAAIWILQLIYSPIWLKYFQYGPAEWLWRSLTYQKVQDFRIPREKIKN